MNQSFASRIDSDQHHPSDARTRLLDAAEKLFGDNGIPSTSIRDITSLAGANLASINYHFGSKEGLLAAVLARRADPINQERLSQLDKLEAKGDPVEIEDILSALLSPTLATMQQHPEFLQFMGRLVAEPDPGIRTLLPQQFATVARRFVAAFHRALPQIPELEIWQRYQFMIGAMAHTWVHCQDGALFQVPGADKLTPLDKVDRLIRFCAAGLRAAPTSHREQYAL